MLFIEYDVDPDGEIEVVALINAVEEEGRDPGGEAWLTWRQRTFDDRGLGCAGVPAEELALLESMDDPREVRSVVERIILADRGSKELLAP